MLTPASTIAFIGFGDVARRMALPLARRGVALRAHDPAQVRESIEAAGVDPCNTLADALRGARLVIGTTEGGDSLRAVAPLLTAGQIYLDLAQAAPDQAAIESRGAHYVAGSIDTVLLLAGARADALAASLEAMGCPARAVATLPTQASDYAALQNAPLPDILTAPLRRGELP